MASRLRSYAYCCRNDGGVLTYARREQRNKAQAYCISTHGAVLPLDPAQQMLYNVPSQQTHRRL